MIEVSNATMTLDEGLEGAGAYPRVAARALRIDAAHVTKALLLRRSVDARKKNNVHFVVTLAVSLDDEALEQVFCSEERPVLARGANVRAHKPYAPLVIEPCTVPGARPVVVGTGPAGLFAALYLARAGLRPLVLERGGSVEERTRAVEAFNAGAELDLATNIQFGEGGAGTFSDGKLTTGTKSPLARHVLQWFVDAGAPADILTDAMPHIGTDYLVRVVRTMREEIESLGGEVRFHAQLVGLDIADGALVAVRVRDAAGVEERIEAGECVLACGHSARDTFAMALDAGLHLEQKPFSMGVRIEHLQRDIDRAQYGAAADHAALGPAPYKLVAHLPNGRSAYTFCMCPGGQVVCAASEEGGIVVNGMSRYARDGENANAALLVDVRPSDFGADDALAGCRLQHGVERAAFELARAAGGAAYQAPAQTVGDFLAGECGNPSARVTPSYARGVAWADLHACLPDFVSESIELALPELDRRLRGFADADAVLTGVETRSSSPVRIVRGVDYQAVLDGAGASAGDCAAAGASGIFPAGEGPGYAGGIMSAAVDGLRAAHALVEARNARGERAAAAGERVAAPATCATVTFEQTVQTLATGAPAIFPTETVYGLGVAVRAAASPQALFELKERPESKPIAWLVASASDLEIYGRDVPAYALDLARKHCPGPVTFIVKASDAVPAAYRSAKQTIGLRVPDCAAALALIDAVGPLATTSANPAGASAPKTLAELDDAFAARVGCVLAADEMAGATASGIASTIIDCTGPRPRIVREGGISLD